MIRLLFVVVIIGVIVIFYLDKRGTDIVKTSKTQVTAIDKAQQTVNKRHLTILRSALKMYYSSNGGLYPDDLYRLVPVYIKEIPEIKLAAHPPSSRVVKISRVSTRDISFQIRDLGGWLYIADTASPMWGRVMFDCSHKDASGKPFYEY
jgi:hypothetical protein